MHALNVPCAVCRVILWQIRASNTSGECSFNMEFRRGHMKWGGQQKECVKRRAELSVQATPGCSDRVSSCIFVLLTCRVRESLQTEDLAAALNIIYVVLFYFRFLAFVALFLSANSTRLSRVARALSFFWQWGMRLSGRFALCNIVVLALCQMPTTTTEPALTVVTQSLWWTSN